ncbi:MAG: YtxH domain-containing protein [Terriglobales bacterium]
MREGKYDPSDLSGQGSHVGTAITFLLIGLGTGAILGFLYAPKTGKQVRKELRRQFESARGTLDDWTGDAKDLAEEALERGVELAEEFREKVGPVLDHIRRG